MNSLAVRGHHLGLVVMPIVPPAEAALSLFEPDEPAVGNGNAMGVMAEIGEDLIGAAKGRLGVDDPFELAQLGEMLLEGSRVGQAGEVAVEAEVARIECCLELLQEQPPEERRESTSTGRKKPGRQATQRVPSNDNPPPGTTQWTWG